MEYPCYGHGDPADETVDACPNPASADNDFCDECMAEIEKEEQWKNA
jgi:hypothetical protein